MQEMNDVGRFHVRLDRLGNMRAAHVHALSERPEEDAWRIIDSWAESRNVFKRSETRVFGRNTYPTDKPEPHGYEFYVTVDSEVTSEGEVDIFEIPGGLYAVLRFKGLENIQNAWQYLWNWIKEHGHEHVGWTKGEYGWHDGFEEHLNPLEDRNRVENWVFDLWVQLKESD